LDKSYRDSTPTDWRSDFPARQLSRLLTRGPKRARTPECHDHQYAERIIEVARQWARAQKNILAVALVGSYARKTARPASDIDLVMLT
jgi:UTP:GlnB (protein PII) uridylyltransferase